MNYIPHHTKKKQILARKELVLKRLIVQEASPEKLLAAAQEIINARIRVLRAKRAKKVQRGDADRLYAKIDSQIGELRLTPANVILAEYGFPVDK